MCEFVGDAFALSRRRFVQTAAAATLAAGTSGAAGAAQADAAADESTARTRHAKRYRTRLVLLGTGGGPTWYAGRKGISSAVVVGRNRYIVDCGEGVGGQYRAAGLGPDFPRVAKDLRAVFLTHLHSDHTIDYNNLLLFGWVNALTPAQRLQVYGPGNRGSLPPVFGPLPSAPIPVVNPENPTPGTVEMTDYLVKAFANDINVRLRDERRPDPRTFFDIHDIGLPPAVTSNPNENPAPPMDPVLVHEDSHVKVTATLVLHRPVFPSLGFRFDSDDGSIVFSGDTAPSENLIKLARGADILVHEVIDRKWVESLFPPPRTSAQEGLILHLLESHTLIEDVGKVAERANVKTLVLSHMVPGFNPVSRWRKAQKSFSGRLIVGTDLMQIGVGRRRSR